MRGLDCLPGGFAAQQFPDPRHTLRAFGRAAEELETGLYVLGAGGTGALEGLDAQRVAGAADRIAHQLLSLAGTRDRTSAGCASCQRV